jgi:hypothetical protein
MLHMCVCMHSRFIENHSIRILEDGSLISEVVLLQCCHTSRGLQWVVGLRYIMKGLAGLGT